MRKARGFTLIEAAVAVAIIGVLAAAAFGVARYAQGNATLGGATFDLVQKVRGLRFRAMSENREYLFVLSDSASGNALDCSWVNTAGCAQWWILRPQAGWALASFNPATPTNLADYDDRGIMPRGVRLANPAPTFTTPQPFSAVQLTDATHSALTLSCGGRACFAFRFTTTGRVVPEPSSVSAAGYAFALDADASVDIRDTRVVLVSFPAGIVKVFTP